MKEVGQRLKQLREEHSYSQTQVAEYLGIDQSNLSKIERGERNFKLSSLIKLCSLYNCSQDYILCRSDEYDKSNIAFRTDGKVDLNVIAIANETMNDLKKFKIKNKNVFLLKQIKNKYTNLLNEKINKYQVFINIKH